MSTKTFAVIQCFSVSDSFATMRLRILHLLKGAGHRALVLFVALGGAVESLDEVSADAEATLRGDTTDALEDTLVD